MFELILGKCQQDPDLVLKILICWIRMKIDRILLALAKNQLKPIIFSYQSEFFT